MSRLQDELTNGRLIGGSKDLLKCRVAGKLPLLCIRKDSLCLQNFGEICFNSLTVIEYFVTVARDFESFASFCKFDDCDIGKFNFQDGKLIHCSLFDLLFDF